MKRFDCVEIIALTVLLVSASGSWDLRRLSKRESEKLNRMCGKPLVTKLPTGSIYRISFGEIVKQGQFPWEVLLIFIEDGKSYRDCSGSIISKYHIVTAAHCIIPSLELPAIFDVNIEESLVIGGSSCAKFPKLPFHSDDCEGQGYEKPRQLHINKIIIPKRSFETSYGKRPGYGPKTSDEFLPDIAVLELKNPISHTDSQLMPICVPNRYTFTPRSYDAYGYGTTEKELITLHKNVQLWKLPVGRRQVRSFTECMKARDNEAACGNLIEVRLRKNQGSACSGDSGGALSGAVNGRHFLFGVLTASSTINCYRLNLGRRRNFFLATNLTSFNDFLCFYTGVCPLGYDVYVDKSYAEHPEPVLLLTKENFSRTIAGGNYVVPTRKAEGNAPDANVDLI